jgi:hypothetical protein
VFELLFHFNANVWGWQTVVIARPGE